MSPLQEKPVLHGRDHCPGGADPIPCMISGPSGSFSTVVLATTDLLAYWRLGETGTPWLDTSGVGTPANLTETGSGTALTPDVTGALPAGQDDGALEFNYDGTAGTGGRYARNVVGAKDFDMTASSGEMTVCAWVKVKASALTRRGLVVGNSAWLASGPGNLIGWGLQVVYPARTVRFTRGQIGGPATPELYAETTGGVVAGDWNFFVGTYDTTEIKLYANGVLVDTTADTSATSYATGDEIYVGHAYDGPSTSTNNAWLYGTVDEAAVWARALTQTEITNLYNAGVEGATSGSQVLLSDGAGGTYWGQVPTAAIENNAVTTGKILDGTIVDADVATGADIDPVKLDHPGGTSTFLRADGTWATPTATSNPALDTSVWMPLTSTVGSDDVLVFDASHQLIPTLTPI